MLKEASVPNETKDRDGETIAVHYQRSGDHIFELDSTTRVCRIDGEPIKLTPLEYRVLETLIMKIPEIVTKNMFLGHLYRGRPEKAGTKKVGSKIIEVVVCHVRKKLGPFTPSLKTEWGRMGYRWVLGEVPVSESSNGKFSGERWGLRRKESLIRDIDQRKLSVKEAQERHHLSAAEIAEWQRRFNPYAQKRT